MSAKTEARDTAAHAIASARRRGLHGRAALADAYQSLTAGTAFLLREGDAADARRWEKASALVFDRWVALDAPTPDLADEGSEGANEPSTATVCPRCAGANGNHGLVHVRYGNGGGSNEPCPRATSGGAR